MKNEKAEALESDGSITNLEHYQFKGESIYV